MMFDATVEGRTLRVEVRGRGRGRYTVTLDDRPLEVDVAETGGPFLNLLIGGVSHEVGLEATPLGYTVVLDEEVLRVEISEQARGATAPAPRAGGGPLRVTAPMPGKLVRVLVEAGQEVAAGQGLLVVEAMKMENELRAARAGRVVELLAREGQAVEAGALLVVVE